MVFDEAIVTQLELSRATVGELNPVIKDWDGETLSGEHREEAGWQKVFKVDSRELAQEWGVTPQLAKYMIRLHANIQRRPSREETQNLLYRMAVELEKAGVPQEQVASELSKKVPYSGRYVRELLPDNYKMPQEHIQKDVKAELVPHIQEDVKEDVGDSSQTETEEQFTIEEPQLDTNPEAKIPLEHDPVFKPEDFIHFPSPQEREVPAILKQPIPPPVPIEKIDTGFVFECPECNRKYHLIHINPSGNHKFEEDKLL